MGQTAEESGCCTDVDASAKMERAYRVGWLTPVRALSECSNRSNSMWVGGYLMKASYADLGKSAEIMVLCISCAI